MPETSCATFFQWRCQNGHKINFFLLWKFFYGWTGPNFFHFKIDPKPYYGAFSVNLKRLFLRKMHLSLHPLQPQKAIFCFLSGRFLTKNLQDKVFSVHTIQNLIMEPKCGPPKSWKFGPTDLPYPPPPDTPQGGQKLPKCIPSSPLMIVNAKKNTSGRSKNLTHFFTRNVSIIKSVITDNQSRIQWTRSQRTRG